MDEIVLRRGELQIAIHYRTRTVVIQCSTLDEYERLSRELAIAMLKGELLA